MSLLSSTKNRLATIKSCGTVKVQKKKRGIMLEIQKECVALPIQEALCPLLSVQD